MKWSYLSVLAVGVLALGASSLQASAVVNNSSFMLNTLPTGAPSSTHSALVSLGFDINMLGTTYPNASTDYYVNSDGTFTIGGPTSAVSSGPLSNSLLAEFAPFLAGIDTSNTGGGAAITYGAGTYQGLAASGQPAFGVDYTKVGYDAYHIDKTNTFQIIVEDRADISAGDFDVYFNYNQVTWDTSDAAGGTDGVANGSQSQPARAGFTDGSGTPGDYYELTGSGVPNALIDGGPDALTGSTNDGTLRSFLFEFRGNNVSFGAETIPTPPAPPSTVPLPSGFWSGLGMLGLLAAGSLVAKRRLARA
jgi:hypothetical protein